MFNRAMLSQYAFEDEAVYLRDRGREVLRVHITNADILALLALHCLPAYVLCI